MRTRLHPVWAFGLLAAVGAVGALGQPCSNYVVTSSPAPAIVPRGGDIGNHCDDCTTDVIFPFPVQFYGVSYTHAVVSSNGVIEFADNSHVWSNSCLPTGTFVGPTIFALWDDLETWGPQGIFTFVDGVAPNRTFDLEWRTTYFRDTGSTANFLVRFYEGLGKFDIIYGGIDLRDSATIGVQAGSAGPVVQVACNADTGFAGRVFTYEYPTAPRITYQGKLTEGGNPANGSYDMVFTFFRGPTGGAPLAAQNFAGVPVTMGLFTVPLDMTCLTYDNNPLFLEITVGGVVLDGRQQVTFAPKAAFALNATQAVNSENAESAVFATTANRAEGLTAPDGSPRDAAVVANNGDVYFSGTIFAQNLVLAPYTRWLILPPAALDPITDAIKHLHTSAASLEGTEGNTLLTFQSPVMVPHDSLITRMEFVAFDNSGDDVLVTLERVGFFPPEPVVIATLSTDGAFPGYRAFSTGPLNLPVDCQNYSYVVRVHWHVATAVPNSIRMSNIRFNYVIGPRPE